MIRSGWSRAAVLVAVALASPAASGGASAWQGTDRREPADRLLVGGTVVTMDGQRRVLEPGALAIRASEIVAVGSPAEVTGRFEAAETIELSSHDLVIPGLVNGHTHAAMVLLRGVADDLALMEWLEGYIFPAEAQTVSGPMVEVGTRLAAMEMIATGTTTFVDMYYFMEDAARVVDEVGLRAVLGETVIDFPAPDHATPEQSLEWTAGFIDRWADHPRVTPVPAPHAPYTVAPAMLRASMRLARDKGVPLLIHLAETEDESAQIAERFRRTPTEHLAHVGAVGPALVGAHGVWLTDGDIELLRERGGGIVHNPESNMKLASGVAPVPELLAAGVPVGLGTDGAASNNDLDLFDALSLAAFLHKSERRDPTALPAPTVFEMATLGGARAIGLQERIGSLEAGKQADVVVLDGDAASLVPRYDVYSHLVYSASGHHVAMTIVAGEVLYREGRFLTLDAEAVRTSARQLAERVRAAVGLPERGRQSPEAVGRR